MMKHFLLVILVLFASTAVFPQKANVRKTTARKPAVKKAVVTDKEAFKSASELADLAEKINALKKFLTDFPDASQKPEAREMLAATRVSLADEKLKSGDLDGAAALYKSAVDEAPSPMSDKLFVESLAKIPAALFWQGKRAEALDIAKTLSVMAESSAADLLALADFYLGIESGADAQALVEKAVALDPNSSKAYLTLGVADRLDFRIEDSAAAYAKALEIDPASDAARRSLADMKRALGKPDEAEALYREILAKDAANIPAQTGLVLSLFDEGKASDAEGEMAKSLEQNPNNMILLAGAAYWYAAHGNGDKAVDLAGKAVETEPRYIWSHIALARGYMAKKQPAEAERVLVKARRYGNFPTLEYELASARRMSGFYREAAEDLRKSFSVKDGVIITNLGGRVPAENKSFTELLAAERRASIFEPIAADDAQNADTLKALLEFDQTLKSDTPSEEEVSKAADAFVSGSDTMTLYRRLYAASALLEKKVALAKVVDLAKAAVGTTDSGFDAADPGAAVMASELYESRSVAFARGEYIIVPDVPRQTLSAILRGRIEELAGWALYYQNEPAEAVVRLKRSVSVLPENSAWWRSSMWRLGAALQADGKETDALDAYIKSYKADKPDELKYSIVESLYKKVNGSTEGLEKKVGETHAFNQEATAQSVSPETAPTPAQTPEAPASEPVTPRIPRNVPMKVEAQPAPETVSAVTAGSPQTETAVAKTTDTNSPPATEATPEPTPAASPQPESTIAKVTDAAASPLPEATPEPTPAMQPETVVAKTTDTPAPPQPGPTPEPAPEATPDPGIMKNIAPANTAEAVAEKPADTDTPQNTDSKPAQEKQQEKVPEVSPLPVTTTLAPEIKTETPAESKAEPSAEPATVKETPVEKAPEPIEAPAVKPESTDNAQGKASEPPPLENTRNEPTHDPTAAPADAVNQKSSDQPPSALAEEKTPASADGSVSTKSLFEPIIIKVPKPGQAKSALPVKTDAEQASLNKPKNTPAAVKPSSGTGETRARVVEEKPSSEPIQKCSLKLSRDSVSIVNGAGSVGILISIEGAGNLKEMTAASSNPKDVEIILEPEIAGAEDKAFYLINSISSKKGIFQVTFELPCAQKALTVTVY